MSTWMQGRTVFERWSLRVIMIVLAAVMLLPFVYVLAVSFSSYPDVVGNNLIIFPLHPTLSAYSWVFQSAGVGQALLISLFVAIVGTGFNMFMTTTLAYGLSCRNVPGSKVVLWMVLLSLLIAPSIITKYLVVRQLHMIDTLWALIIPGAIAPFNLIVLRQFFLNIPQETHRKRQIGRSKRPTDSLEHCFAPIESIAGSNSALLRSCELEQLL